MDSRIHQLLQRPLHCWVADVCLISDEGTFTAGVQGIIGFKGTWDLFFSEASDITWVHDTMHLHISTSLHERQGPWLLGLVVERSVLKKGYLESQGLGKGFDRLPFLLQLWCSSHGWSDCLISDQSDIHPYLWKCKAFSPGSPASHLHSTPGWCWSRLPQ